MGLSKDLVCLVCCPYAVAVRLNCVVTTRMCKLFTVCMCVDSVLPPPAEAQVLQRHARRS